jgi:DNA-binding NarL/FixJ family response regulator
MVAMDIYKKLTFSQNEVLELLLLGYNNKKISKILYIEEISVKKRIGSIMKKLECKNKCQLVKLWFTNNY